MFSRLSAARRMFRLDRHDVRSSLPATIQAILQNGLLYRAFEDALSPDFLYAATASSRPWGGSVGDTSTFTKPGLLTPVTTPLVVGNDPAAATYSIEQYSATMNQYGNSMDTNLLQSSMALASKFIEDNTLLAVNAGQSLNRVARNKLYAAYGGGRTWATSVVTSTTIAVNDTTGFGTVLVNGVPTAVSVTNPLPITVNGVANTVVSVNSATSLTLGTSITTAVGQTVLANNAPVSVRNGAATSRYGIATTDLATAALFRTAVARLRSMAVPTVNGNYVAHIDATTEAELFADADFKQAYQGRGDSEVFQEMSIGTFLGIDWVRNIEAPTTTDGGSTQNLTIHRPIVFGGGALIAAPFENMGTLLADVNTGAGSIELIGPSAGVQVAHIVRPPLDKLQQVVSSSWSWVGDFAVPSDSGTGDAALYKRGVVIEHY